MSPPANGGVSNREEKREQKDVEKNNEEAEREDQANNGPPDKATFQDRAAHFTWPWFACTMSTGAVAVVIANTPYKFKGLLTIGKIFFILDIILFLAFTFMITTRFILVPRKLPASLYHPVEGLFFGAYWVSVSLILNATQAYGVPNSGPWLVDALRVLFWLYCILVLLVAIFQYYVLFQEARLNVEQAMPAWIFPIYPLLVVGTMAAVIIPSQPKEQAFPMWVSALMFQGVAWTVALMMYSIYTQRLMSSMLPPPPTRPGMFVSVGPAGYTSAALFALGSLAPSVMPPNLFSTPSSLPSGHVVAVLGAVTGTFILLFSFWFFCISSVAVIAGLKRMSFTLNWWAFIFPNAGLTLAMIQMGKAFQSTGINVVCSVFTVLLIVFWFIVAFGHIKAVWTRQILWPGKDEDKDMKGIRWGRQVA